MIQALQWFNKLSLLLRQRHTCQPVDWGPAFPIAHLWTRPLREKADLTSGFTGLCVWSVQFLYTDKWLGLFSSVWGWTRRQSCWDETKGCWCAPSPLHPSYLCIGLLPSLKSLQTPLFLFPPSFHLSVFPSTLLSALHSSDLSLAAFACGRLSGPVAEQFISEWGDTHLGGADLRSDAVEWGAAPMSVCL